MSKRERVLAFTADGEGFHLSRAEAAEIVRDGGGDWLDSSYDRIRLNRRGALRMRGLSCRVGPELAKEFRRDEKKEGWAAVATSLIQLALPRQCKKPRQRPGYTMLHRLRPAFVDLEKTA